VAYFTKAEARAAASSTRQVKRRAGGTYDSILKEEVKAAASATEFDIFLSHSINDAELVIGVKALLEAQGLTVYVDWTDDPVLDRSKVTKETARLLRQRMRQSKSLVYLATENSTSSKWMPWEVGYFDGFKPDGVAIMPVLDHENQVFSGQEYLGLYPIVTKDRYTNGASDIFVEERGARWSTLKAFGRGRPQLAKYGL
jgi:TIR domain